MTQPIRLAISACLLGKPVRFDGGDRRDAFLANTWGRHVEFVEICPETGAGLGIPREPMRLRRDGSGAAAIGMESGRNHTADIIGWCDRKLGELLRSDLHGCILKSKSPSCAGDNTDVGEWEQGLFAAEISKRNPLIPLASEREIQDPALRDLFVTRIFTLLRWRETKTSNPTRAGLIAFHTANKLLFLAHSPAHYRNLGRIVAMVGKSHPAETVAAYEKELFALLGNPATTGRHVNVLQHIAGYFRGKIDASDKAELIAAIESYRLGLASIAVPITLANHHAGKHPNRFLESQTYLHPLPLEIRLRG